MSPESVLAEIERRHGPGIEGYPSTMSRDNAGTPYVTIMGSGVKDEGEPAQGGQDSVEAAALVFIEAVDAYAQANRRDGQTLVWRNHPELRTLDDKLYYRARLCFE